MVGAPAVHALHHWPLPYNLILQEHHLHKCFHHLLPFVSYSWWYSPSGSLKIYQLLVGPVPFLLQNGGAHIVHHPAPALLLAYCSSGTSVSSVLVSACTGSSYPVFPSPNTRSIFDAFCTLSPAFSFLPFCHISSTISFAR